MSNKPKFKKDPNKETIIIKDRSNLVWHSYIADLGGCGYIRIVNPTTLLNTTRIKNYKITSFYSPIFVKDPDFYKQFLFVQFQRSATNDQMKLFEYFNKYIKMQTKTGLVYEIDDLLMFIPEWNYASDYYKQYEANIKQMMKISDGLTVSTKALKDIYSKYNNNIEVIPNHLLKYVWGTEYIENPKFVKENKPRVLWAGSSNHFAVKPLVDKGITQGDFSDELMDFIKKSTNDYQWVFVGGIPHQLDEIKDKLEIHRWQDIFSYASFIQNLDIDYCIAPLANNVFNSCKSNIKVLEYTAMGCPGIYSYVDRDGPYNEMFGCVHSQEEMIDCIKAWKNDPEMRCKAFEYDYAKVKDQLFWEDNDNLTKYVNSYLKLFNRQLEN